MLEKLLTPLFYALLSLKWLQKTLDVYREKAEEQLQEMVNSVKSICLGPTAWVIDGIFKYRATNPNVLKQLSHKDFLTTLDVLCEQFLRAATRSRRVIAICNNILATVPTRGEENEAEEGLWVTASERVTLQQHLQTLHTYTWNKMQQQMGTMLEARSELHSQLPVSDLRQVWDHCMDFVSVAGRIYGTKGKLLLSTLLRQARDSLEYMHKNQLVHLQSLLHEEMWKPALVPSALQNEVTGLHDNPRVGLAGENHR